MQGVSRYPDTFPSSSKSSQTGSSDLGRANFKCLLRSAVIWYTSDSFFPPIQSLKEVLKSQQLGMVLTEHLVSGVGVSFGWFFQGTLLFTVLVCFVIRSLLICGTSVCSCLMCHAGYMYKWGQPWHPQTGQCFWRWWSLPLLLVFDGFGSESPYNAHVITPCKSRNMLACNIHGAGLICMHTTANMTSFVYK